ncbi:helix-turn-helix transcriptional regulator [Propioniciclava sinopodophylli]|uniref:helix-turn-helix transcriptional regulator n=1 Tax=Propioniciclava sinopodophylli TaxID=1837344 RepID=UPI0024922EF7|nr:helix-turn-helix transcriptional regulator [Propioniciclava sinopodophylli]
MSSFERLLAQKLADPAVKAGFDDAARRRRVVEELVEARKEQGLTQKQVGKLIGVSQSTVAEFETGGGDPRLGTVQRYARVVNRRVDLWVTTPVAARMVRDTAGASSTDETVAWARESVAAATKVPSRSDRADFALAS